MKRLLLFTAAALGLASAQTTAPLSAPVASTTAQRTDSVTVLVPKSAGGPAVAKASPRAVDVKV